MRSNNRLIALASMGVLAAMASPATRPYRIEADEANEADDVVLVKAPREQQSPRRAPVKTRLNRSRYSPHFGKRQAVRLARNIELGRIPADQRA